MSAGKRKHLPVSVRQHLRNLRAEAGGEYNQVWRGGGPWQSSEVPGGTDEKGNVKGRI